MIYFYAIVAGLDADVVAVALVEALYRLLGTAGAVLVMLFLIIMVLIGVVQLLVPVLWRVVLFCRAQTKR